MISPMGRKKELLAKPLQAQDRQAGNDNRVSSRINSESIFQGTVARRFDGVQELYP
jgi:hypothetical protein